MGRVDASLGRLPRIRQSLVAAALLGGLSGIGGCAEMGLERGFSGRDAEWARTHAPGDFAVVSASHSRAVVSALGQQVAVEPANGFCLAEEAIETSDRSAFLLLGDCAIEDPAGNAPPVEGLLDLPSGVPGIITISISGDPGFSRVGGDAGNLADLQSFVETSEGRALLGRGGDGDQVAVADSRRIGNTLYVLVEDSDGGVPVLAPRFWRAFLELNDRLAVVTISGFRDRPLPEEEMLRHLGDQVRQLQVANSEPLNEVPIQFAEAPRQVRPSPPSPWRAFAAARSEEELIGDNAAHGSALATDLRPTSIIVATESGEQDFWPVPERRGMGRPGARGTPALGGPDAGWGTALLPPPRRLLQPPQGAAVGLTATTSAPAGAPQAPRRP
jgi:hypothetical protein